MRFAQKLDLGRKVSDEFGSRSAACITASSTARQARSLIWSVLIDQIGLVASRAWSFLGAFRIVYNSGMIGIRQCGCPRDHVWRETLA